MESNLFENKQNLKNNKNGVKLYLEACINKKIEKPVITLFDQSSQRIDISKNSYSFKIWVHHPEILRDAQSALNKGEIIPGKSSINFPKTIKFKIGELDIQDIGKSNRDYLEKTTTLSSIMKLSKEDTYTAVLIQVFVTKVTSHMVDDHIDLNIDLDTSITDTFNNNECYYLCKHPFDTSNNNNGSYKIGHHWFAVKEPKNMKYLAQAIFSVEKDNIVCSECNLHTQEMLFCQNDNRFFCPTCDDTYHNKFNSFKKHKRPIYKPFSITYQSTCNDHSLKAYEFYCLKCKAVYCIDCLTNGEHKNFVNHEVKYLVDVAISIELESKALTERIRQINHSIAEELNDKDKGAK